MTDITALQEAGRHDEALAAIEARLDLDPEDWEAHYLRARSEAAQGRPSAMLRELQIAVARRDDLRDRAKADRWLDPWRANPYVVLALGTDEGLNAAWHLLHDRKPDEAAAALEERVKTAESPAAWFLLSVAAASLERSDQAIQAATRTTELLPEFPDGWFNLGFAYGTVHRHDDAVEAYRTAVRVDPGFVNGWFNLGMEHARLGRIDEAERAFAQAIVHHPHDPTLLYKHAECLARLGRVDEAETELERAAAIDAGVREAIGRNPYFPKAFDAATLARLTEPPGGGVGT